jgi:hypothetical protein
MWCAARAEDLVSFEAARRHKNRRYTVYATRALPENHRLQSLLPVNSSSALDFEHQGDRDGRILFPPFADAPRSHKHDEIAFVRALS